MKLLAVISMLPVLLTNPLSIPCQRALPIHPPFSIKPIMKKKTGNIEDTLPLFVLERLQLDSNLLIAHCRYKQEEWLALHQYQQNQSTSWPGVTIEYYSRDGKQVAVYNRDSTRRYHMIPDHITPADIRYSIPDTVQLLARQQGVLKIEICNYRYQVLYLIREADYKNTSRQAPLFTDTYYTENGRVFTRLQYIAQWIYPRRHKDLYPAVATIELKETHTGQNDH